MLTIRPIQNKDIPTVKQIIHRVAFNIFGFDGTLEDSIQHFEEIGAQDDLSDIQNTYFDNKGTFLVVDNGQQVIGSGAVRKLDDKTAELKRMWLLDEYHGQGIGYRLLLQLFDFSREKGYTHIRLQTSPEQVRALGFYQKTGFYEIPCYNDDFDEISMEIQL